jgi:uncharacterized membrane protein YeiH
MQFSQISKLYVDHFASSYFFVFLHAFSCAFTVKKQSETTDTRLKLIIGTFLLGYGGNIGTSILLGEPMIIFFNPKVVPIYSLASIAMNVPWVYLSFEKYLSPQTYLLNTISASSRAPAMYKFITKFRSMQMNGRYGRESLGSQFVLGTLSATGGGIMHQWFIRNQPFRIGGWFVYIVAANVIAAILSMELLDPKDEIMRYLANILNQHIHLHSIDETQWKLIFIMSMSLGFNLQPGPSTLLQRKTSGDKIDSRKETTPKQRDQAAKFELPDGEHTPLRRSSRIRSSKKQ